MVSLRLDESRRITGPNLLSNKPGAVLEVYTEGVDNGVLIELWKKHCQNLLQTLGLTAELYQRIFEGGVSLGLSADEDMLYSACEINEAAAELARAELSGDQVDVELASTERLTVLLIEERNPSLMALIAAADEKKVTYLVDDDDFSLGMGQHSRTWSMDALPDVESISWRDFRDIPVALITGTNGKSTSVRMCEAIVNASSISAGVTSTDYIRAADTIIDTGDYSGPSGARILIRDRRVELAILEVARGGILRRGLGINKAEVALVTNVAEDHLGQYGINTVDELIAVKLIVARAISAEGTLVLNADDRGLVNYVQKQGKRILGQICWFSLTPHNEQIIRQKQLKRPCVWFEDNQIYLADSGVIHRVMSVNDIPTTMKGLAKHNIANSMGAVALCYALGIGFADIAAGLSRFKGDSKDNPGRGNYFNIKGVTVLIDFAHNPHSLSAIIDTVTAIPAKRRLIMLGQAGDRSDRDILNLTKVAMELSPDAVITTDIPEYLRGREEGEIPAVIRQHCIGSGLGDEQIFYTESCLQGAKKAMSWAQRGDFILLLALDQREQIFDFLHGLMQEGDERDLAGFKRYK